MRNEPGGATTRVHAQQSARLEELLDAERRIGFEPAVAPLMRGVLIRRNRIAGETPAPTSPDLLPAGFGSWQETGCRRETVWPAAP